MGTTADNIVFNIPGTMAEDMIVLCGRFDIIHDPDVDPAVYAPIVANQECNGFSVKLVAPSALPFLLVTLGKFPRNQYDSILGLSCNVNWKGGRPSAAGGFVQFWSIEDQLGQIDTSVGYLQDQIEFLIKDYKDEPATSGLEGIGILMKLVMKSTSRFRGTTTYKDDS